MNTAFLCLLLAQVTPSAETGGTAFFKVGNVSNKQIIVHISAVKGEFSQVITLEAGAFQWVAVKHGNYKCGLANGDMQTCGINAGQILQIDLPWKVSKEDKAVVKEDTPKKEVAKKNDRPPPVAAEKQPEKQPELPVAKEPEKKEPERKPPVVREEREPPKKGLLEPEKKEPEKKVVKEHEPEVQPKFTKTQALVEINNMPEDGRIWFDDHQMKNPKQRWVKTPDALNPGQRYYYTVRAEVTRNGMVYVDQRILHIQAGYKTTWNVNLPK